MFGYRRIGWPVGLLPTTRPTRRKTAPSGILVKDPQLGGAELLNDLEGMPRYCLGCESSKTIFGGNGIHRKNGPLCPQMGHEPLRCARSVGPLASSTR
jgi:hypothetical protein